jgi:hypothetical protein
MFPPVVHPRYQAEVFSFREPHRAPPLLVFAPYYIVSAWNTRFDYAFVL